jgi:hypothetical protein
MLKLIIGLKGSGKTKQLIELANKAVEVSPGNVVCVEKSNKLTFDVNHKVRLIDTETYGVAGADQLYGLVCGVLAANFDFKDLYIDSSLKICKDDMPAFAEFIKKLDELTTKLEVNCVTTVSAAQETIPEELQKYIF